MLLFVDVVICLGYDCTFVFVRNCEALAAFKSGANPILVATDVAARGFRAWSMWQDF